jgi:cytochrome c-type biogenesis protein CcmH/NrfG
MLYLQFGVGALGLVFLYLSWKQFKKWRSFLQPKGPLEAVFARSAMSAQKMVLTQKVRNEASDVADWLLGFLLMAAICFAFVFVTLQSQI